MRIGISREEGGHALSDGEGVEEVTSTHIVVLSYGVMLPQYSDGQVTIDYAAPRARRW